MEDKGDKRSNRSCSTSIYEDKINNNSDGVITKNLYYLILKGHIWSANHYGTNQLPNHQLKKHNNENIIKKACEVTITLYNWYYQ